MSQSNRDAGCDDPFPSSCNVAAILPKEVDSTRLRYPSKITRTDDLQLA